MWTEAFVPFGLTPPQAFSLRAVLQQPGLLQSELADALVITRPTATRALDGLEVKKLVVRRSSSRDGREVEIHPTARAVALKEALDSASRAVTVRIKRTIGDGEFSDVVSKVRAVRSALD